MAAWLYQMSVNEWTPEAYRLDIWESEQWRWVVRRHTDGQEKRITDEHGSPTTDTPQPGDTVFFSFAKTDCPEPGFYGLAVVSRWHEWSIYFRPTAPSDRLKMYPLWDEGNEFRQFTQAIRPGGYNGTLWRLTPVRARKISQRIFRWVGGHA